MDWVAAASLLADREDRPLVTLDRRGRIQVANAALCRLLGAHREELLGQACYRVLAQRQTPCAQCPVRHEDGRPWPRTVVREARRAPDSFEVVTASLRGPDVASIQVHTLSPEALGGLFQARLRRLADKALLSERERDVLGSLALGRAPADISPLLGISERTVKFHQTNLLRKPGAETRFDLIRLLL